MQPTPTPGFPVIVRFGFGLPLRDTNTNTLTMPALADPFDSFVNQAWSDHAEHADVVAARLHHVLPLVRDDDAAMRAAALAHHVMGEHLGRWRDGLDFMARLFECGVHGPSGAASIARCQASLRLCDGLADERGALSASDRCRVSAMAAANLAALDAARAAHLLDDAMALALDLPDADPAVRALAANSNGIAATLQELVSLQATPRSLMLKAAQVARSQWARAGTWLEVERAEYRLALCWLAAGDAAQALHHARHCEAIVRANGAVPLELFFAAEPLCLTARALGHSSGQAAARAMAQQAFDALPAHDQAWCGATLDKINAS